MILRPLGRFVGHFFLESLPGGFIANKKLTRGDFFLGRGHILGFAGRDLRSGKYWLFTHDQCSSMVKTLRAKLYSLARVMCIPGNHMSHAPLGVLDIPLVTGNDADMGMENTLPGGRPHVNPDIVAIRVKFGVNALSLLVTRGMSRTP